jgi:hypothetical protein
MKDEDGWGIFRDEEKEAGFRILTCLWLEGHCLLMLMWFQF